MKISKLGATLLASSLLCATASFAAEAVLPGEKLPAQQSMNVSGKWLFNKSLKCKLSANDYGLVGITFIAERKNSIVNNFVLPEGNSTTQLIQPGKSFNVTIEPRGHLKMINNNDALVLIDCK